MKLPLHHTYEYIGIFPYSKCEIQYSICFNSFHMSNTVQLFQSIPHLISILNWPHISAPNFFKSFALHSISKCIISPQITSILAILNFLLSLILMSWASLDVFGISILLWQNQNQERTCTFLSLHHPAVPVLSENDGDIIMSLYTLKYLHYKISNSRQFFSAK